MPKRFVIASLCALTLLMALISAVSGQQGVMQPSATDVTPDTWPKTTAVNGITYAIYHPQVDSWDGYHLATHAVVSVLPAGAQQPTFGVITMQAKTVTDRQAQTVYFDQIAITHATFPSDPGDTETYQHVLQQLVTNAPSSLPLARLTSSMAVREEKQDVPAVVVANITPQFIFTQSPTVLVLIDGAPVWRPMPGTTLERLINTRALIFRNNTGTLWMHLYDGFLTASSLTGPWTVATNVPPEETPVAQNLADANVVDLMPGEPDETTNLLPLLQQGAPQLVVATTPTELIVTAGVPHWMPIPGTSLQYVENTTGNVFKDQRNKQYYVLVTGRWFRAPGFDGPWHYIPGHELPSDFAKIPDDSPKENVKASIPETPQSQDALIANAVPQMAQVDPAQVHFAPILRSVPVLAPIEGTPLQYVENCQTPIIRVNDTNWYAVQDGIWFTASSLDSTWTVATAVPPVIYTIPPNAPLYYVTSVRIYDVTPSNIVEGYTPGYLGAVTTTDGVVVYGTSYAYPSYIVENVWYPAPITYGYATNLCWTPWTSWIFGFGFGWESGTEFDGHHGGWGPAPYWGAHFHHFPVRRLDHGGWGPNSWAATAGDVYRRWGGTSAITHTPIGFNAWKGNAWSNRVGHAYNSATGHIAAGQRAPVTNVYTGNYAYTERTHNITPGTPTRGQQGGTYFSDRNGIIYRNINNRWQQYQHSQWNTVPNQQRVQTLQSQQWAQRAGDQRTAASAWGGAWGNNFQPGAGRPSESSSWNGGQFSGSRGNLGSFHSNNGGGAAHDKGRR